MKTNYWKWATIAGIIIIAEFLLLRLYLAGHCLRLLNGGIACIFN